MGERKGERKKGREERRMHRWAVDRGRNEGKGVHRQSRCPCGVQGWDWMGAVHIAPRLHLPLTNKTAPVTPKPKAQGLPAPHCSTLGRVGSAQGATPAGSSQDRTSQFLCTLKSPLRMENTQIPGTFRDRFCFASEKPQVVREFPNLPPPGRSCRHRWTPAPCHRGGVTQEVLLSRVALPPTQL